MTTESNEKVQRTLALLLHNEFCTDTDCSGGAKDYMAAAGRLLPKIERHVLPPGKTTSDE